MSHALLPGCKSAFNVIPYLFVSVDDPKGTLAPNPKLTELFSPITLGKLYFINKTASPIP